MSAASDGRWVAVNPSAVALLVPGVRVRVFVGSADPVEGELIRPLTDGKAVSLRLPGGQPSTSAGIYSGRVERYVPRRLRVEPAQVALLAPGVHLRLTLPPHAPLEGHLVRSSDSGRTVSLRRPDGTVGVFTGHDVELLLGEQLPRNPFNLDALPAGRWRAMRARFWLRVALVMLSFSRAMTRLADRL